MSLKKTIFALSACVLFTAALTAADNQKKAIEQAADLDQQIHDLQVRRDRCRLRQKLAYDSAGRRQNLGDYIGYRQDMQTITFCQQKIKELDERIAALELQKQEMAK